MCKPLIIIEYKAEDSMAACIVGWWQAYLLPFKCSNISQHCEQCIF